MTLYTMAYLALGSNLGDRSALLEDAVAMLDRSPGIRVIQVSSVIETDPVGPADQPKYLNAAVSVQTVLSPEDLLERCLEIERSQGRDRSRTQRWGPRLLDIDVLLFGSLVMRTATLTVPHPRLHERQFVLEPLAEIAESVVHPRLGKTTQWWCEAQKGVLTNCTGT